MSCSLFLARILLKNILKVNSPLVVRWWEIEAFFDIRWERAFITPVLMAEETKLIQSKVFKSGENHTRSYVITINNISDKKGYVMTNKAIKFSSRKRRKKKARLIVSPWCTGWLKEDVRCIEYTLYRSPCLAHPSPPGRGFFSWFDSLI